MKFGQYRRWNRKKYSLNLLNRELSFHEREIWFCYLGLNIGFEQNGNIEEYVRPILILKKFNPKVFLAIPLTRTIKKSKYYFIFRFKGKNSSAILSQIKLLDYRRLNRRIGYISKDEFVLIKRKIREFFL